MMLHARTSRAKKEWRRQAVLALALVAFCCMLVLHYASVFDQRPLPSSSLATLALLTIDTDRPAAINSAVQVARQAADADAVAPNTHLPDVALLSNPPDTSTPPSPYPAFACAHFLADTKAGKYDNLKDPNGGMYFVRQTVTEHPFWWSTHTLDFDKARWTSFVKGFYYEMAQTAAWVSILKQYSEPTIVLDVGGNIGYYSLLTASMNHVVHAFEPNLVNVLRFCESVVLNKWEDARLVNLHTFGISDQDSNMTFYSHGNPGAGTFDKTMGAEAHLRLQQANKVSEPETLMVTSLDRFADKMGWFDTKPTISILKVDVEGHEGPAMLGGSKLFESQLVQNIIVEMRIDESTRAALEMLVKSGYELYKVGGWIGPKTVNKHRKAENFVDLMFTNTTEFKHPKEPYANMWWKLPTLTDL
jgi:FkbM family methyltransferase